MDLIVNLNNYYYGLSDPQTRDWFLMDSIWYPIGITLMYVLVVFKLAPAYMKNRPAYKLNTHIKFYNLFQVFANAYIAANMTVCYPLILILKCSSITYTMNTCDLMILKCGYYFILLKLVDLFETVIFILRKKNNQVSFLHVYHHISTYWIALTFIKYISSKVTLLHVVLNSGVHVLMYSYYFLSNFEGSIKQTIISFKRYLTLIQMGQFMIMIGQLLLLSLLQSDCNVPKLYIITMLFNVFLNFWLFYSFYKKTYINSTKKGV